jgi:predicted  nucleic acid-binding Zn-ribbon protein
MGIEDLRARLDRLLREQGLGSPRREAGALHEVLVELKVGLKDLNDALSATERELTSERDQLATAERRGKLAEEIRDTETVTIAAQYADRHRQRIALLERKLAVQRDELAITEQEYQELSDRYRAARQGVPAGETGPPPADGDDPGFLKARFDRQAAEAAANAQLELLKKKLGKTS